MTATDDERVRALVRQLDEAVPREGDVVVHRSLEDDSRTLVKANRLGYLRLGVELLKAADAPARDEASPEKVEVDLSYLTPADDPCYSFERHDNPRRLWRSEEGGSEDDGDSSSGGFGAAIGAFVVLFFIASLVVGAFTILKWLGGLFL